MSSFLFRGHGSYCCVQETPKKKIVVASGCRGCGISFVTSLILDDLQKRGSVSAVEMGQPYFMDALALESRFLSKGFEDCFDHLRSNTPFPRVGVNELDGIHWVIRKPRDTEILNSSQLFRLYHHVNDNYNVFDCSSLPEEISLQLLSEADVPIAVISPLPSKLALSRSFIEQVRFYHPHAILVVNQMNAGVHLSELQHFLGTKDFFSIPSVPANYISKAEYNAVFASQIKEVKDILKNTQDMLFKLF